MRSSRRPRVAPRPGDRTADRAIDRAIDRTVRPARRDRRGRGLRGTLAPPDLPRTRSRSEQFDDYVLDAVEELETHWAAELADVEFAVEDVPASTGTDFDPEVVVDRGVPLGRLLRAHAAAAPAARAAAGVRGPAPTIVVYRRPVEARAHAGEDRADLIFMVVAELVAELLGKDLDELDD